MVGAPITLAVTARDGGARATTARTPRGEIRTPCFMPVGTRGAVKHLAADDLRELGVQVVLANTYHLMLRPGADTVAGARRAAPFHELRRARAHRLRRVPSVLALAAGRRRRRHVPLGLRRQRAPAHARACGRGAGGTRRRHPDGLGRLPSVAVSSRGRAARGRTHRELGGARGSGASARGTSALRDRARGRRRRACAGRAPAGRSRSGSAGYGIGGLSVGETREEMLPALAAATDELPTDRLRYLMGVGDPVSSGRVGRGRSRPLRLRASEPARPPRHRAHRRWPHQPAERRLCAGRQPDRRLVTEPGLGALLPGIRTPPAHDR